MSSFTPEAVRKIADLARIQLTDEESAKFAGQLDQILGYIDKLNTLETSAVEPLLNALDIETPMRVDEIRPSPGAEVMTACAPEPLYEQFKVPQVIGGGGPAS